MKILSAHIDGFGKFKNSDLTFSEGLNILYGRNEAGKTTLHNFLEAMLFGPDRKSRNFGKSVYDAMEPWDEEALYRGRLRILHEGKAYEIIRDFRRECESFMIKDEETGLYVEDPQKLLSEALSGLTPTALRNTVSIGQLSAKTGPALSKELKTYIENVGDTQNPDLSAEAALRYLKEKKSALEASIKPDAAKDYAATLSRIKKIEAELSDPENDNRLPDFLREQEEVAKDLSDVDRNLIEVESSLSGKQKTLSDNHLRFRDDVTALDEKTDSLYENWKVLRAKKKAPWKIAGIVLSAVLLLTAAALWFLMPGVIIPTVLLGAGAAALLLLILFTAIRITSVRRFQAANAGFLRFMKEESGGEEITDETVSALKAHFHRLDDVISGQEQDILEKEQLGALREELLQKNRNTTEAIEHQHRLRAGVEGKLDEENSLRREAALLKDAIAANNRLKEQIDAVDIAMDTISDLRDSFRDRIGTYLNDEASATLAALTGGRYRGLEIGNGSEISLNTSGGMISARDVSAGTVDQIYLSLRLAAARYMTGGKDSLPLIFDDSFTLYDDDRLRNAVRYIAESFAGQVLIFTCQRREAEACRENGTEYRMIEL